MLSFQVCRREAGGQWSEERYIEGKSGHSVALATMIADCTGYSYAGRRRDGVDGMNNIA